MLRAWNKGLGKLIEARVIDENPAYKSLKNTEWICPDIHIPIDIKEIMKIKGITELKMFYISRSIDDKRSHFRCESLEWLDVKRINESDMHKLCKEGLYYDVCDNLLKVIYHKENKNISELCDSWDYEYEEHLDTSKNSKIADLVIKFNKEHPILGKGILFEVQLSFQKQERTNERTRQRILRGYSVAWLWEEQFGTDNKLKNKEIKVCPFRDELEKYDKDIEENAYERYFEFEEFINNKIKCIRDEETLTANNFFAMKTKSLNILKETLKKEEKEILEDYKKLINEKLELSKEDIELKYENYIHDYFLKNDEKVKETLKIKLDEFISKQYKNIISTELEPKLNHLKIEVNNRLDDLKNKNQESIDFKAKEILSKENVDGIINNYIQDAIKETFGNFAENLSNSFNLITCPSCKSKVPINYLKWMPFEKKQAWCLDCYTKYKKEQSQKMGDKLKRGLLSYGK